MMQRKSPSRRTLIIATGAVVLAILAIVVVIQFVIPSFATPAITGVPTARNPFATKGSLAPAPDSGLQNIRFVQAERPLRAQQAKLYVSCTEDRRVTPTPTGGPAQVATAEPTIAATAEPTAAGTLQPDLLVLRVIGEESEACYQVGEVFINRNNQFALAVGVTKSIDGFVQIDRSNVANSQISEININISEFRSDSARRDGIIRERWLESNRYPIATLTDARFVGLPARRYQDGEKLTFQIVGNLKIKETVRETTFYVMAWLTGDTLVVTGYTDIRMSDFNFDAPSIAGTLRANDEARIVLNLVARPE